MVARIADPRRERHSTSWRISLHGVTTLPASAYESALFEPGNGPSSSAGTDGPVETWCVASGPLNGGAPNTSALVS